MSNHYLGNHFDIHCGGVDNIFPHHENEIAQSCAATDSKFVNYWMHNEHLLVEGQKMSKSEGNFYTLRQLLELGYSPEALRYTLISIHYRQKLNFTFDKVKSSQKCINKLRELKRRANLLLDSNVEGEDINEDCISMVKSFNDKLSDDLNISGALGKLFSWVNEVFYKIDSSIISSDGAVAILNTLEKIDSVLCVIKEGNNEDISSEIKTLISNREVARSKGDWGLADDIRDKLYEMGVILEDTKSGTIWKKK